MSQHEQVATPHVDPVNPHHTPQPPVVAKKTPPDLSKVVPIVVTRNEIELPLTPFAGTRESWDGRIYQAPQLVAGNDDVPVEEDEAFLNSITWLGKSDTVRYLNVILRRLAQDCWDDAIPETGENAGIFNEVAFIKSIETLKAAALRISELQELYNEANATFQSETQNLVAALIAGTMDKEKVQAELKRLGDNVNYYKLQLEERKARRSKEKQTDSVRPE